MDFQARSNLVANINQVGSELMKMKPLLPTYFHLITSAVFPIYIAAHASLRRPPSAAPAKKNKARSETQDEDEDDDNKDSTTPIESLTTSDAVLFPILAGVTLTGLYLVIKWLEDPALLNKILGYYFSWVGTFFTYKFIKDFLYLSRSFVFPAQLTHHGRLHKINTAQDGFAAITSDASGPKSHSSAGILASIPINLLIVPLSKFKLYWSSRRILFTKLNCTLAFSLPLTPSQSRFSLDTLDLLSVSSSIFLAILPLSLSSTPWYLTNLSGFAFSYGSLQFISPGTSGVGSLLLSLLFFYDIYMVFFTPMMVTVATKLDVPIKLLIPRPVDRGACPVPMVGLSEGDVAVEVRKCLARQRTMAMLGLGDIVVPGIMIAFALRFDLENYYRKLRLEGDGDKQVDATAGADERRDDGQVIRQAKPAYIAARGMWAERTFTAREHWSLVLKARAFPKPYFTATTVGYVGGMVVTVVVMQVFKHAQPALLYLVPGVLLSLWGTALFKGETKVLWRYDEAIEEKEAEQKQKEKEEKEKKQKERKDIEKEKDIVTSTKDDKPRDTKKETEAKADPIKPTISFNIFLSSLSSKAAGLEKSEVSEMQTDKPTDAAAAVEVDTTSHEDEMSGSSSAEFITQEEVDTDTEKTEDESSEEDEGADEERQAFVRTEQPVKRRRKV